MWLAAASRTARARYSGAGTSVGPWRRSQGDRPEREDVAFRRGGGTPRNCAGDRRRGTARRLAGLSCKVLQQKTRRDRGSAIGLQGINPGGTQGASHGPGDCFWRIGVGASSRRLARSGARAEGDGEGQTRLRTSPASSRVGPGRSVGCLRPGPRASRAHKSEGAPRCRSAPLEAGWTGRSAAGQPIRSCHKPRCRRNPSWSPARAW